MKKEITFTKRVVSQNSQENENLLKGFKNEVASINEYWHKLNAILGTLYKLSDLVAFIENPSILVDVFTNANKKAAIDTANESGIDVKALNGLDNIALNSKQQGIINELQKFSKFSMFKNGLSSKDWLVKEEIVVTEKVEEVFEELTTQYTKGLIANNRLNVLEAFEQHLEIFPEDKATIMQILRHGNGRQFINYGL